MPKSIRTKHKKRMFPFDFYDELSEQLTEYVIDNPAFLLNYKLKQEGKEPLNKSKREELYFASLNDELIQQLNANNIIEVEPFGEVLTLELCTSVKDVDTLIHEPKKRSQIPLRMLIAQLYDSSGLPVFSKDVTEETIAQIPEVLWDDPNLMLGVVSFGNPTVSQGEQADDSHVGVIKIPEQIEKKLFESID